MKKKYISLFTLIECVLLMCIFFTIVLSCIYPENSGDTITIMTYNVQELFDDVDNGTEYSEYDPGIGNWNNKLFIEKCNKISEVIKKSFPHGPDIVALQEVENLHALETLCEKGLKGLGYSYRVLVPEQGSATNTGILSRICINRVRAYSLPDYNGHPLRKIIEAQIIYRGELLYLFNNHWKSKLGGCLETEVSRREAASIINNRLNEILYNDPYADIIILGDFNENVDEYFQEGEAYQTALIPFKEDVPEDYYNASLFISDIPVLTSVPEKPFIFFETWYEEKSSESGSYVHNKVWQTPDHFLLSNGLFHEKGFMYKPFSFAVMNASFLLDPITGFPRSWDNNADILGYSDHLPLLITLCIP